MRKIILTFLCLCSVLCSSCVKLPRYFGLPSPYRDFVDRDKDYYR